MAGRLYLDDARRILREVELATERVRRLQPDNWAPYASVFAKLQGARKSFRVRSVNFELPIPASNCASIK